MIKTRRIAAVAAAVLAIGAMTACSTDSAPPSDQPTTWDESLLEQAKAEGELTLYNDASEDTLQAWVRGFTDEYGIKVTVLRLNGGELFQRFSQETVAGQNLADVFGVVDRGPMEEAVANGWLAEYTPTDGPEFPDDIAHPRYYYPVQNASDQAIIYNLNVLSDDQVEMLQDDPIAALADPSFRGQIALNAPFSSQSVAAFYYMYAEGRASEGYGWPALEAIAENDPALYDGSTQIIDPLVAGEFGVGFGISNSAVTPTILQGAPVGWVYPKDTVAVARGVGISAKAPHPAAARLFMEWATSPEGVALYSTLNQTEPLRTGVDFDSDLADLDWYVAAEDEWFDWGSDEDFLAAAEPNSEFLTRWASVFGYTN